VQASDTDTTPSQGLITLQAWRVEQARRDAWQQRRCAARIFRKGTVFLPWRATKVRRREKMSTQTNSRGYPSSSAAIRSFGLAAMAVAATLIFECEAYAKPQVASTKEAPGPRRGGAHSDIVSGGYSLREQLEALTESDLKQVYRTCTRSAIDGTLGKIEIAGCSIAYDVLLNKHYRGDFDALLEWSSAEAISESDRPQ
jgi:hypothetical protein